MNIDNEQKTDKKGLAPEGFKTHGEKMHHAIFNSGINFWFNLTASAAFSFWVAHSHNKLKLPGMKTSASPSEIQSTFGDWLLKTPIFSSSVARKGAAAVKPNAHAVAEVATLLTPGFAIMVPSVWLGEKYKKDIVRYFDKQQYGERPEDNKIVAERYAAMDSESKPTLLGATTARFGTMALTLTTSRFIGAEKNWMNGIGKWMEGSDISFINKAGNAIHNKFPGVNPIAGKIGDYMGDLVTKILPDKWILGAEKFFTNHNYRWSGDQITRAQRTLKDTTTEFANTRGHAFDMAEAQNILDNPNIHNRPIQNFSKYLSMDVLYTAITASSVYPVLSTIGIIPGMKYKQKPTENTHYSTRTHVEPAAPAAARQDIPVDSDKPSVKVGNVEHQDRLVGQALASAR